MQHAEYMISLPVVAFSLLLNLGTAERVSGLGTGADLEIGGPGNKPGQFLGLQDMVFDAKDRLYTLDGYKFWDGAKNAIGNCRVEVFDNDGRFLTSFSVLVDGAGDKNNPCRLAVDSRFHVFVSQNTLGTVVEYAPPAGWADGKVDANAKWEVAHTYAVPDAFCVATGKLNGKERIAVIQKKGENDGYDKAFVLDPATMTVLDPIPLDTPLRNAIHLTIDSNGCLYAAAQVNQIYKFDSKGKHLFVIGAGTTKGAEDGSELQHTIALDSKGNFYSMTPANPGSVCRFSPDGNSVTRVKGQFGFGDPWGPNSGYVIFAVDGKDRLWIGAAGICEPRPNDVHHFRPCILRTTTDFFAKGETSITKLMGLDAQIVVKDLDYNIAYEIKPIQAEYILKPAIRRARDFTLDWFVYDVYKNEIEKGSTPLPAEDGKESRQTLSFTPPAYGWYEIECQLKDKEGYLMGVGAHVGVTPKFPGMTVIGKGESTMGWCDAVKFGFTGIKIMRTNTRMGNEFIEKCITGAQKYGINLLVQFESKDHCDDANVRKVVGTFKGRVKYWELVNEPNFSMSPVDYGALVKRVVPIIKQIDPQAKVMGPDTCGINLGWNEEFFKTGAASLLDIISEHDYEENEAISPSHWIWKYGEFRKLMEKYKLGNRQIWQTERAISGERFACFMPGLQAVRITLHRDLLDTLGVPNEHNNYYYMNNVGYSDCSSYIFSSFGPHPAALALRTRYALVLDKTYKNQLDFGVDGNKVFMGLRFLGKDGSTIILRQLGTATPAPIELGVRGGDTLTVVDSFGNSTDQPVKNGKVALTVPPLPLYLRLKAGQDVIPPKMEYGPNLAKDATFVYSSSCNGAYSALVNGLFEVSHQGNPWGPYFSGGLANAPQTLDIELPSLRHVNRVAVYSARADNPVCDLLDFDLQYHDGTNWVTLQKVRTPCPPSQLIRTPDSGANTWYMDQNMAIVEFPAIATRKLRIVALKSTYGAHPDAIAAIPIGWKAGGQTVCLREIEVTGGEQPIMLNLTTSTSNLTTRGAVTLTAEVTRSKAGVYGGTLRPSLPKGWRSDPAEAPFSVIGGKKTTVAFKVLPSPQSTAGKVRASIDVFGPDKQIADSAFVQLTLIPATEVSLSPVNRRPDGGLELRGKVYPKISENLKGALKMKLVVGDQVADQQEKPIDLTAGRTESEFTFTTASADIAGKTVVVSFTAVCENHFDSMLARTLSKVPVRYIGPFPNENGTKGFAEVYPPEKEIDLMKTYKTVDGDANWKQSETRDDGFFDLVHDKFKTLNNVCAYVVTFVNSPVDQDAILSCGSDDGLKAWVNQKIAISNDAQRGAVAGDDNAKITLKKGWNTVLLKITQGGGAWACYLELKDPNGQALTNVSYADELK